MTIEITSVKLSHGVVTITAIDCSEEHLQYMERCRDDGQTGNYLGGCFKCNYWHCNNN